MIVIIIIIQKRRASSDDVYKIQSYKLNRILFEKQVILNISVKKIIQTNTFVIFNVRSNIFLILNKNK